MHLCQGECYNPTSERRPITRLEIVRIRPQQTESEEILGLVEDPWRVIECAPTGEGCVGTFTDETFAAGGRDALYYARAIEAPSPAVAADPLGCRRDAEGRCVAGRSLLRPTGRRRVPLARRRSAPGRRRSSSGMRARRRRPRRRSRRARGSRGGATRGDSRSRVAYSPTTARDDIARPHPSRTEASPHARSSPHASAARPGAGVDAARCTQAASGRPGGLLGFPEPAFQPRGAMRSS